MFTLNFILDGSRTSIESAVFAVYLYRRCSLGPRVRASRRESARRKSSQCAGAHKLHGCALSLGDLRGKSRAKTSEFQKRHLPRSGF